jgi:sulfatase modifying factor 1
MRAAVVVLLLLGVGCGPRAEPVRPVPSPAPLPPPKPRVCPAEMATIGSYCVDRYEAYVVELDAQGNERPHSPFDVVDGLSLRAKSARGVTPQGYISRGQARGACENAGKRLCTADEFVGACNGGDPSRLYPYGPEHKPGACNEGKGSTMVRFFGWNPYRWTTKQFNDPRLNQAKGGLAPTGSYPECVSPAGVYDCVGNLHEWVDEADPQGHGRFRGGFYGDAENNGSGCTYVTHAHMPSYHDYSTGFRCCADPR